MEGKSQIRFFESKVQFVMFLVFWLCFFVLDILTTQFFKKIAFNQELLYHSLLVSCVGFILGLSGYWVIKCIRKDISSNLLLIILSTLIVYTVSFIWTISHHLLWWTISGNGELILEYMVYPMKALLFFTILLTSVLLMLITEMKLLSALRINIPNNISIRNVKEMDYEEIILLPSRNNIHKVKVDSIKLISANDYYSNVVSESYSKSILSKYSLKKWEQILPKKHFVRVHRSSIVNLNYIEVIKKKENNTYKISIKRYEEPVDMSRRHAKNILEKHQL